MSKTTIEGHYKARGISSFPAWRFRVSVLWLSFALRIVSLTAQGMWRDEVDQWRFARQPLAEMLRNFLRPEWNGPLYSPMLRGWMSVAGDSVFSLRYFSLLWGVLGIAAAYVLARRLAGRAAARWTILLMALSPYLVWYAQEVKMYTWVPLMVLLALYALERACQAHGRQARGRQALSRQALSRQALSRQARGDSRPRWTWWVLVAVATMLAFYSHILAALLIPVLGLWFLLRRRRPPWAWVGALLVFAFLTLPYLPLFTWQVDAFAPRETGYPSYTLQEMALMLLNGWSAGIYQGALSGSALIPVAATFSGVLALLGAWWLLARRSVWAVMRVLVWLLLPLLAVWAISLRRPLFTDRYLIWTAPAFYLLVGCGLAAGVEAMRRLRWLILLPFVALAGVAALALYSQASLPIKPQFAAAVRHVAAHRQPGDLLLFQIPYNRHVFEYYATAPLLPLAEAPYTNWPAADGGYQVGMPYVDQELRHLLEGRERVWLIYSEVALWDARELVKAWLVRHYTLADIHVYHGVTVYLWER